MTAIEPIDLAHWMIQSGEHPDPVKPINAFLLEPGSQGVVDLFGLSDLDR